VGLLGTWLPLEGKLSPKVTDEVESEEKTPHPPQAVPLPLKGKVCF